MYVMRIVAVLLAGTVLAAAQIIPGQYIAVFKDHVRQHPAAAQAAAAQHGLAVAHVYQHALKGFAFAGSPQAVAALSRRADIAYIEPDQMYHAWQQELPTGISRAAVDQVWIGDQNTGEGLINNHPAPELDVDIAIIDTGISTSHPDLNVVGGQRFYVQGIRLRQDTNYNDDNGHGTHVAGTAAAIDNGIGVVGVAPGARLWAVKVLDRNGSGSLSGIIKGIDWVIARAGTIEVANMSLGGGYSQAVNDAVKRGTAAGIVFVVAAGNSNADARNYSPASEPTAITVSALADSDGSPGGLGSATSYGPDDSLASFSNYGPAVDIAAPGVDILSTYLGSGYATASGTSMAAPHVAGAAALYMAGMTSRPTVAKVIAALLGSGWTAADACCYFNSDRDIDPEPLLNVAKLMGTVIVEPPPSTITLTATGYIVRRRQQVDLTWSGATGTTVTLYRNDTLLGTTANDGGHTDAIGAIGGGTYTYRIEDESGIVSNSVTVVF